MDYNEYIKQAYETAFRNGFHDEEKPMEHWLMLVITEVAEIVEADRKGKHAQVAMFKRECMTPQPEENKMKHWAYCFERFIKDTVEDEMADACIRLFDLAGMMGFEYKYYKPNDEELLSKIREARITTRAFNLCVLLTQLDITFEEIIERALFLLVYWAKSEGIDLEWHICQKMEYNKQRKRLHGKRY